MLLSNQYYLELLNSYETVMFLCTVLAHIRARFCHSGQPDFLPESSVWLLFSLSYPDDKIWPQTYTHITQTTKIALKTQARKTVPIDAGGHETCNALVFSDLIF